MLLSQKHFESKDLKGNDCGSALLWIELDKFYIDIFTYIYFIYSFQRIADSLTMDQFEEYVTAFKNATIFQENEHLQNYFNNVWLSVAKVLNVVQFKWLITIDMI